MKKLMIASAIAMMCLSANAFAEDDGYGNDIPPARSEGTVDDGYGNKLPAYGQKEYKSFEEARSSSKKNSNQRPQTLLGIHFGIGYAAYYDYPTDPDFLWEFGENEWSGISMDFGLVLRYRINNAFTFVPELNIGMSYLSEEYDGVGYDRYYGWFKVRDTRTLINVNVPLALRLTVPFVYLETGVRLNFNMSTSHDYEYTDEHGNAYEYIDDNGEVQNVSRKGDPWKVKAFVPSVLAGLGTTMRINGHECDFGVRVFWDLVGIEKEDQLVYDIDEYNASFFGGNRMGLHKIVENNTKMFSVQFVFNYFFG